MESCSTQWDFGSKPSPFLWEKDGTRAYLCWNAVLGQCKFGKGCKFKKNHPGKGDLPDVYASSVVSKLKDAVAYVMASKESPAKKMKVETIA